MEGMNYKNTESRYFHFIMRFLKLHNILYVKKFTAKFYELKFEVNKMKFMILCNGFNEINTNLSIFIGYIRDGIENFDQINFYVLRNILYYAKFDNERLEVYKNV